MQQIQLPLSKQSLEWDYVSGAGYSMKCAVDHSSGSQESH